MKRAITQRSFSISGNRTEDVVNPERIYVAVSYEDT
jgi:hypothetical protein